MHGAGYAIFNHFSEILKLHLFRAPFLHSCEVQEQVLSTFWEDLGRGVMHRTKFSGDTA